MQKMTSVNCTMCSRSLLNMPATQARGPRVCVGRQAAVARVGWAAGRTSVLCTGRPLGSHPVKGAALLSTLFSPLAWKQHQ